MSAEPDVLSQLGDLDAEFIVHGLTNFLKSGEGFNASVVNSVTGIIPEGNLSVNVDTNKLACVYQVSMVLGNKDEDVDLKLVPAVLSLDYNKRRIYLTKRGDYEELLNISFVELVRASGNKQAQLHEIVSKEIHVWPTLIEMGLCSDPQANNKRSAGKLSNFFGIDDRSRKSQSSHVVKALLRQRASVSTTSASFDPDHFFEIWAEFTVYFMGRLPMRIVAANPDQRDNIMQRLNTISKTPMNKNVSEQFVVLHQCVAKRQSNSGIYWKKLHIFVIAGRVLEFELDDTKHIVPHDVFTLYDSQAPELFENRVTLFKLNPEPSTVVFKFVDSVEASIAHHAMTLAIELWYREELHRRKITKDSLNHRRQGSQVVSDHKRLGSQPEYIDSITPPVGHRKQNTPSISVSSFKVQNKQSHSESVPIVDDSDEDEYVPPPPPNQKLEVKTLPEPVVVPPRRRSSLTKIESFLSSNTPPARTPPPPPPPALDTEVNSSRLWTHANPLSPNALVPVAAPSIRRRVSRDDGITPKQAGSQERAPPKFTAALNPQTSTSSGKSKTQPAAPRLSAAEFYMTPRNASNPNVPTFFGGSTEKNIVISHLHTHTHLHYILEGDKTKEALLAVVTNSTCSTSNSSDIMSLATSDSVKRIDSGIINIAVMTIGNDKSMSPNNLIALVPAPQEITLKAFRNILESKASSILAEKIGKSFQFVANNAPVNRSVEGAIPIGHALIDGVIYIHGN